ncbi:MAG: acyl-CoA thioesterase [Gemmatimonadetes bacterium]|nr:acyl-CoA thioesterase [Gemmatimonadota bacterium]
MARTFVSRFRARSYELDALGHLNHAVFLNYFEHARFDALEKAGLPPSEFGRDGWVVYVVRVEMEYRREVRLGEKLEVRTEVEEIRNASMTIRQQAFTEGGPDAPAVEARVVAVWIGRDGRPARIPDHVRGGLGFEPRPRPGAGA